MTKRRAVDVVRELEQRAPALQLPNTAELPAIDALMRKLSKID